MLADVKRNLVTVDGARDYGVVISDGRVDEAATEKLRDAMRKERGDDIATFNFGPSLDEILASSKEETGLDAPERPVFR